MQKSRHMETYTDPQTLKKKKKEKQKKKKKKKKTV